MKTGKVIGTIAAVTLGTVAGVGIAAAAGAVIGLKKWAKDEESDCIRIVLNNTRGIRISKTEDKDKFEVEMNYDWQTDPDFMDCENCCGCGCDCDCDDECDCCDCDCADESECNCCCVEIETEERAEDKNNDETEA